MILSFSLWFQLCRAVRLCTYLLFHFGLLSAFDLRPSTFGLRISGSAGLRSLRSLRLIASAALRLIGLNWPKPHQYDIKATFKRVGSQAVGTLKPPWSHPEATPNTGGWGGVVRCAALLRLCSGGEFDCATDRRGVVFRKAGSAERVTV
jgi:hypothetical protein